MTDRSVTKVEATYRVTTPMFCGGAHPESAELRLPSFKGVLRFWWRALAWMRLGGDLERIKKEEASLFGSADGGQSRVVMSMRPPQTHPWKKCHVLTESGSGRTVGPGVRYLGYGLMEPNLAKGKRAGELTRPCLQAPFDFTVRMALRCHTVSESRRDVRSLRDALEALGTLGGLGARSRKGFGSLALRSLDGASQCDPSPSSDELGGRISALYDDGAVGPPPSSLPPITAMSAGSRHLIVTGVVGGVDALELLDEIGQQLKGCISELRPKERRIAFGLPRHHSRGQIKPQPEGGGERRRDLDRRASPLFIHIHECGGEPVAVVSFLPAEFLPNGNRMVSVGRESIDLAPEGKLHEPIHYFLDRLLDSKQRGERISAKEVHL